MCLDGTECINKITVDTMLLRYGVKTVNGNNNTWTSRQKIAILAAVGSVARRLGAYTGQLAINAFKNAYNTGQRPIIFLKGTASSNYYLSSECGSIGGGGCNTGPTRDADGNSISLINFETLDFARFDSNRNNVVHELGHLLDALNGYSIRSSVPQEYVDNRSSILRADELIGGQYTVWQLNSEASSRETFADMFVAWTFNTWSTDPTYADTVSNANNWMTTNMSEWVP